jgi:hypothetical protein
VGENYFIVKIDGIQVSPNPSITVEATGVNNPPVPTSTPNPIITNKNTSATSQVSPNDPDLGDTHTYAIQTPPTNGSATVNGTGLVTYTPNTGFVGSDSFVVRVTDNGGKYGDMAINVTVNDLPSEITVFSDSFEITEWNGLWTEDSQNDWFRSRQRARDGSYSAEVDGLATDAKLISIPIDLKGRKNATITFSWFIESGLDTGEYLAFDISTNGGSSWAEKGRLRGNVDTENIWHNVKIELTNISSLRLRFRGTMSSSEEDANLDIVKVVAR